MANCSQCSKAVTVTDLDRSLYGKFAVPEPTLCPDCRNQQRLAFRNEIKLYHRACDLCQKQGVSLYSPDKLIKSYCTSCWWSDQLDPLQYGQDFDFSRPFFQQYQELTQAVPRLAIQNMKSENCEFTNFSCENKNCYLVVGTLGCENCYHSYRLFYCRDCLDCFDLYKSEGCYECLESTNLYNCQWAAQCENSSNLVLAKNCIGCHDCFGSVNLRNKQYHIFNHPYNKESYRDEIKKLMMNFAEAEKQFAALKLQLPHRATRLINCQESSGDQLSNDKNCQNCYVFKNSEECSYAYFGDNSRFCSDVDFCDNCELQYNSIGLEKNYNIAMGNLVWYSRDSRYVSLTFNSHDCFGCIGLKRHQYCIFNKQYGKEQYEGLLPKVIDHMKGTGEWGQYFPIALSPFFYNETAALSYFPLTQEQAKKQGFKWKEETDHVGQVAKTIPAKRLPDSIKPVPDDILNWAIECESTKRPFRIIPQELRFYREHHLPIPHLHPEERHKKRLNRCRAQKLYPRTCTKCQTAIQSTYSPDRREIVYCEQCYLSAVY